MRRSPRGSRIGEGPLFHAKTRKLAMADDHGNRCPSTAAVSGHPIHPMLIPFPIAFLIGALATDLAFVGTGDGF
jgi:hypothetical protein